MIDMTKLTEGMDKNSLAVDAFGYIGRMIVGVVLIIELVIFFNLPILYASMPHFLIDVPLHVFIFSCVIFLGFSVLLANTHIAILHIFEYLYKMLLYKIFEFLNAFLNKLTFEFGKLKYNKNTATKSLWQIYKILIFPIAHYYGIPAISDTQEINFAIEEEVKEKLKKYFNLKNSSNGLLENLSSSLLSCEHLSSTKSHIDEFSLVLLEGSAICFIYAILYFLMLGQFNYGFIAIVALIFILIKTRFRKEYISAMTISDALVIINKQQVLDSLKSGS